MESLYKEIRWFSAVCKPYNRLTSKSKGGKIMFKKMLVFCEYRWSLILNPNFTHVGITSPPEYNPQSARWFSQRIYFAGPNME